MAVKIVPAAFVVVIVFYHKGILQGSLGFLGEVFLYSFIHRVGEFTHIVFFRIVVIIQARRGLALECGGL